jgi:hypothetical protein
MNNTIEQSEIPASVYSDPIRYVTYREDGVLDGCYWQVPPQEHIVRMIPVNDSTAADWPHYRANDARDDVESVPPAPVASPQVPDYVTAVQSMLDMKARERLYDSILSACTYATSTQPKFQSEGQACVAWRDAVWAKCYDLMSAVDAGTLAQPTIDELLSMLPTMEWPE